MKRCCSWCPPNNVPAVEKEGHCCQRCDMCAPRTTTRFCGRGGLGKDGRIQRSTHSEQIRFCSPCWRFSWKNLTTIHSWPWYIEKLGEKSLSRFGKFILWLRGSYVHEKIGPSVPITCKWMHTPTLVSMGPKIVQKHRFCVSPKSVFSIQFWWTCSWYFQKFAWKHISNLDLRSSISDFLIYGIFIRRKKMWL